MGLTTYVSVLDSRRGELLGEVAARLGGPNGQIVGALEFSRWAGEVWLRSIMVDPRYRRRGIATAMVEALKEYFPDDQLVWQSTTPEGEALRLALQERRGKRRWKSTPASREEARAKVQAALDTIAAGVEEMTSGDDWKRMLRQMAKFHKYSFGNVMLIKSQNPKAELVAGYRTWQKLGRQVMRGEKGIMILAPRTFKKEVETPEGDTEERRGVYFRAAYVFDISQTEGDDLIIDSVIKPLEGQNDTADEAVEIMSRWLAEHDVPVEQKEIGKTTGGYYDSGAQLIVLNSLRGPLHQFKTLVHETAHLLLHTPEDRRRIDFQHRTSRSLKDLTRDIMEVEAESTAFVVLSALGIDSAQYSFGYVANWSEGNAKIVSDVGTRIHEVADYILSRVLGVVAPGAEEDEKRAAKAGELDAPPLSHEPDPAIYALVTGDWEAGPPAGPESAP